MLHNVTKKLKRVALLTQSKSKQATRKVGTVKAKKDIHVNFHPFLRLPKELRLTVYDNVIGTSRRLLPLSGTRIYFEDLDLAILQTCKQIAEEANPILQRRRSEGLGPPTLTIRTSLNRYDIALYFLKTLLKLIGEGRAAEIEEAGSSVNIILPWSFSRDKDRNISIGRLSSVKLSQGISITNGRDFQAFYRRTMRQLRQDSIVVVRLLIDDAFNTHPFNVVEFWNELAVGLKGYARMIKFRFIFVVPKQHLEGYKKLAVKPRSVPLWITEEMWSVEVAKEGGVDPAID